jgi:hypothetical protein
MALDIGGRILLGWQDWVAWKGPIGRGDTALDGSSSWTRARTYVLDVCDMNARAPRAGDV